MIRLIKYFGTFLLAMVIIAVIGVFARGGINTNNDVQLNEQKQQTRPTETNDQYRMSFTFDGDKSQIIDLIKGKVALNLVYTGESRFNARILNADGTLIASLVDVNGPYNGTREIEVPKTDNYILNVKTEGEWSLTRK